MRSKLLRLAIVPLLACPVAGVPITGAITGTGGASPTFQIRATEILLSDGTRIDGGVVLVEDGRVRKVGRGVEVSEGIPVVTHDGVLTAGIVVCQSESGAQGESFDSTRSILPEARMAHAFDPSHSDFRRALEAGITSLVLSPSAANVVGGQAAVVKSHGGTLVKESSHLALSFSKEALGGMRPDAHSLEDTGRSSRGFREPTSYSGALRMLTDLFAAAEGAFALAKVGELPVLIEAWDRNEVLRAATFAKQHGLRGAVHGVARGRDLAEAFRDSGLGVVVGPYGPGQPTGSLETVAALVEVDVPIAFALGSSGNDPDQVRLTAAMAVAAGADPVAVWRGLTSEAALLANADGRVGRLDRGLDADLVVWSGDPLNLTSRVLAVYVDGVLAYREENE